MSMGDRLIVLRDGVVQQMGTPLEIYNEPANRFVASFIGSPPMNFISCSTDMREGQMFLVGKGLRLKLPTEKQKLLETGGAPLRPVILGIRPEDILERRLYDGPLDGNVVEARVEFVEALGSEAIATCTLGEREIVARLNPRTRARSDEMIELVFDMTRAMLFDEATGEALA
jgi:multiple sugar transport system ATP-binding protein